MPLLKDNRKKETITLPDSKITVVISDGLLASDVEALEGISSQFSQTLALITRLIDSWDAQDENEASLPITVENVKLLSIADLKHIQDNLDFVKSFLAEAAKQDTK
jgi:hypothetical protein